MWFLPLACGWLVGAARAADPTFEVRPTGWVSPQYTWESKRSEPTSAFALQARLGAGASSNTLRVRARIEAELLPTPSLQDAFAVWQPSPATALFAGQFKVPYSLQALSVETRRQFSTRAEAVAATTFDRDLGVMAGLRLPVGGRVRATLDVAAMNGEGANQVGNPGEGLLFAVRGTVAPLGVRERPQEGSLREPFVAVGGGWVSLAEENAVGVDVQVAAGPFSIQAEYLDRARSRAGEPEWSARGAYGQLGSFIPAPWVREHLEVVLRGGWSAPHLLVEGGPDAEARITVEAGVNLYAQASPSALHDVKVQVGFRHTLPASGTGHEEDRLDVATVARF